VVPQNASRLRFQRPNPQQLRLHPNFHASGGPGHNLCAFPAGSQL
jgi:hypothetical protein